MDGRPLTRYQVRRLQEAGLNSASRAWIVVRNPTLEVWRPHALHSGLYRVKLSAAEFATLRAVERELDQG